MEGEAWCGCCYEALGAHADWCPVPRIPQEPTAEDGVRALSRLGELFFNGRSPGRDWTAALWRAALTGIALIGREQAGEVERLQSICAETLRVLEGRPDLAEWLPEGLHKRLAGLRGGGYEAPWARELKAGAWRRLREDFERLRALIHEHHAGDRMGLEPGEECPVCAEHPALLAALARAPVPPTPPADAVEPAAGTRVWYEPSPGIRFAGVVVGAGTLRSTAAVCLSAHYWRWKGRGPADKGVACAIAVDCLTRREAFLAELDPEMRGG